MHLLRGLRYKLGEVQLRRCRGFLPPGLQGRGRYRLAIAHTRHLHLPDGFFLILLRLLVLRVGIHPVVFLLALGLGIQALFHGLVIALGLVFRPTFVARVLLGRRSLELHLLVRVLQNLLALLGGGNLPRRRLAVVAGIILSLASDHPEPLGRKIDTFALSILVFDFVHVCRLVLPDQAGVIFVVVWPEYCQFRTHANLRQIF
mmetsp:Transcript_6790/g.15701  ORF Transcript_6790/g.15701 Transcript_6790/m.15701 type:complete len:203 (-) Transcript_6790:298-906(-)